MDWGWDWSKQRLAGHPAWRSQVKTNLGGWSWESDGSGFPVSSVGKESACNAGNPGLIPGSGRSTGEGIGYPLQYSWASPVAQLVKNPPAVWETWVQSLDWEDFPGKKERLPTPVFWPGEFHGLYGLHGVAKSQTRLSGFHFYFLSSEGGAGAMKCGVNCGDTPNTHTNMLTHKHAHTHTQGCPGVNSLAVRLCALDLETLIPVGENVSSLTLWHACFFGCSKI